MSEGKKLYQKGSHSGRHGIMQNDINLGDFLE